MFPLNKDRVISSWENFASKKPHTQNDLDDSDDEGVDESGLSQSGASGSGVGSQDSTGDEEEDAAERSEELPLDLSPTAGRFSARRIPMAGILARRIEESINPDLRPSNTVKLGNGRDLSVEVPKVSSKMFGKCITGIFQITNTPIPVCLFIF